LKAEEEDAAHFIICTVHKCPHEVTIYAGGPLTNLAQAISLDPKVPELAREPVVMGGSIAPVEPLSSTTANRREFNFWWDVSLDIDTSHTAGYGNTLVWMPGNQPDWASKSSMCRPSWMWSGSTRKWLACCPGRHSDPETPPSRRCSQGGAPIAFL
jgi:hypothetical protein